MDMGYDIVADKDKNILSHSYLVAEGFAHTGTQTIIGKLCKLYTRDTAWGTEQRAMWNQMPFLIVEEGSRTEATKITFNVPAKFFDQTTLVVDWI
jgi:hypothetical protein